MFGDIIGLLGFAGTLAGLAYMTWDTHQTAAIVICGFAALCAIGAVGILVSPRIAQVRAADAEQRGRGVFEWRGPVSIPTLLWFANIAGLLACLVLWDISSIMAHAVSTFKQSGDQMVARVKESNATALVKFKEGNATVVASTDRNTEALKRTSQSNDNLMATLLGTDQKLPDAPLSDSVKASISGALRRQHHRYRVEVFRDLDEQCIALAQDFSDIFRAADWQEIEPPQAISPESSPGIDIWTSVTEPPYLGATLLLLALRQKHISAALHEWPRPPDCQCIVVDIRAAKPKP